MRIAIVGAGGIGGLLGAKLALAGADVTFIVRGEKLEALRRAGITLIAEGERRTARGIRATDDWRDAGPHDAVIVATKATQVASIAPDLPDLFDASTLVVPMQNGIPWWYFDGIEGPLRDRRLASIDPDGTIAAHVPASRVIGCVVYPAAELVAPGVVRHLGGDRLPLGELDGATTPRIRALSDALAGAGFEAPILDDIRSEIWLKVWGNATFNPLSALTRATLADMCREPGTRALAAAMMEEIQAIANRLGITFRLPIERRIDGAARVGAHKTSMLQDVEAGRPIEIDAVLGSVIELGRLTGTPTPHLDHVYGLAKLLAANVTAR